MNTARVLTGVPVLIMLSLVVGAGLLEYVNLTTSGLWLDELASVFFSETSESISYLYYSRMVQDTSPPLYYILLHYWMCIFGDGEYPVRMLTWLAAIMTAAGTYLFATKSYSRITAFVLTACLFCSPAMVQYSIEARAYAFLLLFSPILILQAIYLCKHIERSVLPARRELLLFVTCGLIASLVHYSGLFLYAVLGFYLLILAGSKGIGLSRILLYGLCTVMIYLVWVSDTLGAIGHRLGTGSGPGFDMDLVSNLSSVTVLSFGSIAIAGLLLLPVIMAVYSYRLAYVKSQDFLVPFITMLGVVVIYWAISLHTIIQTPRNFLTLLPSLLVLSVIAASRLLPMRLFAWAGTGVCVLFMFYSIERATGIKSEMREAAAYISGMPECRDGQIYTVPDMGRGSHHFEYYLSVDDLQLITDRKQPFEGYNSQILQQECPVVLWIMHWTDRDVRIIKLLGLQAEKLRAVRFINSTVYIRKAKNNGN